MQWGATAGRASVAVLGLHGRGQNPEFIRTLSERIDMPGAHWVAPAADGDTWYPYSFLEPIERNQPHLDGAVQTVERSLDALESDGFGAARTVIVGFSQGACLLSHVLLTRSPRIAGAAILTGGYQGTAPPPMAQNAPLARMPIVMSLGTNDPFVPFGRAEATRDALRAAGATVEWLPFDGAQHVIDDGAVLAIRSMLVALTR